MQWNEYNELDSLIKYRIQIKEHEKDTFTGIFFVVLYPHLIENKKKKKKRSLYIKMPRFAEWNVIIKLSAFIYVLLLIFQEKNLFNTKQERFNQMNGA